MSIKSERCKKGYNLPGTTHNTLKAHIPFFLNGATIRIYIAIRINFLKSVVKKINCKLSDFEKGSLSTLTEHFMHILENVAQTRMLAFIYWLILTTLIRLLY